MWLRAQTDRQTAYRRTHRQTNRQTDIQTYRQTGRQADQNTDRQTPFCFVGAQENYISCLKEDIGAYSRRSRCFLAVITLHVVDSGDRTTGTLTDRLRPNRQIDRQTDTFLLWDGAGKTTYRLLKRI